jgi:hypothetical protein
MITDEMVEKAEAAASDLWTYATEEPSGTDAMRAALEAVAPLLIAQGLREAADLLVEDYYPAGRRRILARAQELDPK